MLQMDVRCFLNFPPLQDSSIFSRYLIDLLYPCVCYDFLLRNQTLTALIRGCIVFKNMFMLINRLLILSPLAVTEAGYF